jgi:hypothetical protein
MGTHCYSTIKGAYENMKKILVVLGICIVLVAMPMTTALPLFNLRPMNIIHNARPAQTNGTFTGVFAMKNESGYIPLGEFVGTYQSWEWTGSFVGTWFAYDGNSSGTMNGWCWGHLFYGMINTTGSEESNWLVGLYRVNTTDNTFEAGSIIFGEDQYDIRYIMGSLA